MAQVTCSFAYFEELENDTGLWREWEMPRFAMRLASGAEMMKVVV